MTETVALIVAAGRGERAGGSVPKQYRLLSGKPVLRWTADAFARHRQIDEVRIVIGPDDEQPYLAAVAGLSIRSPIIGGATRQESVRKGLEALSASPPERVLIHDGARPLVS